MKRPEARVAALGGPSSVVPTLYWRALDDGRVQCDLCPRHCRLREGQRGLCFVRACLDHAVVLTTYGLTSGLCIDPIEKKPLHHFLPGTAVLSFGTAGCNLTCRYCQNWSISRARHTEALAMRASPETVARAARRLGCDSVAFTYNDPVIFHEYAIDTADACRGLGIRAIAVTAGYVCDRPRAEFYRRIDAVNVDLKSFRDDFYRRVCGGRLEPVLDTLRYIRRATPAWLEITNLLIPGHNDGEAETEDLTRWVVRELGPDVPIHFSAFHPDWMMRDVRPTPLETLVRARQIARKNGVRHAYTGNVRDVDGSTTYCHACGAMLIGRSLYAISAWGLSDDGRCRSCGVRPAGVFRGQPGNRGGRSMPVTPAELVPGGDHDPADDRRRGPEAVEAAPPVG
jgi:pyruvate formate lyase activating enzyme